MSTQRSLVRNQRHRARNRIGLETESLSFEVIAEVKRQRLFTGDKKSGNIDGNTGFGEHLPGNSQEERESVRRQEQEALMSPRHLKNRSGHRYQMLQGDQ